MNIEAQVITIFNILSFQVNQMEEEEGEDEEMGVAETYADYWPSKCKNRYWKSYFLDEAKCSTKNIAF